MILSYLIHFIILFCIYLILALSLQISIGYTGLFNFGHIAFYAIGAYASALLSLAGVPFVLSLAAAAIISMVIGLILSWPLNRLKGDYLVLATIGFSFIIYVVALNWIELTRGSLGLAGIPRPVIFNFTFNGNISYLFLTLIITLGSYLIIKIIVDSPFGRVLTAIRDNELAVKILGKNTSKMKSLAIAISAFFAGIAGSLYAHYITFIDPSSFYILQIVPIIAIVIIGGLASLRGTIIATAIILMAPEVLRFWGLPASVLGPMRQIFYVLILMAVIIYRPKGFYGQVELE